MIVHEGQHYIYQPGLLPLEVWAADGGTVEQLSQIDQVAGQPLQWSSDHTALLVPRLREVGEDLRIEEEVMSTEIHEGGKVLFPALEL